LKDLPGGDLEQHQERRFRTAVDRYYEYSDSLLADALRWADERTVVICMSDHGFEDAVFQHSRAPDGFFIMAGGPVLADPRRGQIHIYDVAPTVLALLGFPVPADMEGKVARDLIDPAFWAQHPIRTITTYETSPRQVLDTEQMRMDPRTIEHLRALGYID
jgi:predicted AlkP superfamily phosphohydrolase/phosphomutase